MMTAGMILREEPASESAHGTLMMLYYQSGDQTSALRQFQVYKEIVCDVFVNQFRTGCLLKLEIRKIRNNVSAG